MKNSTCYIINFYLGNRRKTVNEYTNVDRICFVRKQIEFLERYSHELGKIVFNFNVEPKHYNYLSEIIRITPNFIQSTPVEINIRENKGMSYGAWSDIYLKYKDQFGYFIFNEDDYFFCQNNWDKYLVDKYNSYHDAGYLCMVMREPHHWNEYKKHTGHATSISSNDVLSKVVEKYGCLPHSTLSDYNSNENEGQKNQSFSAIELGYNIYDIRDDFRVSFAWTEDDGIDIHRYFWWNDKDLIIPAFFLFDYQGENWYQNFDGEFIESYTPTTQSEALDCYINKHTYYKEKL